MLRSCVLLLGVAISLSAAGCGRSTGSTTQGGDRAQRSAMDRAGGEMSATGTVVPVDTYSAEEFDRLLTALRAESFDQGKLSLVKSVAKTRSFTSEQVRAILKEFSFDNDRETAAIVLHPRVSDPHNFFIVFEAFTFDNGRTNVRKKLGLE